MRSGDTVRVHVKVREGDKERIQIFEGVVIGMHAGRHTGVRSPSARCRSARASSGSFRCTRRRFRRSR
jgi:ribosomal protein L19